MKKSKKALKIFLSILGVILIAVISFVIYGFMTMEDSPVDSYGKDIITLNETYPSDIMLYGDDVVFRETLKYRKIDKIDEESLNAETQYHYLIVNDLSRNAPLTREDIRLISDYVTKKRYTFFYLGTGYGELFVEEGLLDQPMPSSERGFFSGYEYGIQLTLGGGFFSDRDLKEVEIYPQLLGENLTEIMAYIIRTEH